MDLSPADKRDVKAMIAENAVDRLVQEMGGSLKGVIVLPLATAAPMMGLTPRTLRAHAATVELTPGKHGITVAAMESFIQQNTRKPQS